MLTRCKVFSRWGVGENILGEQEEGGGDLGSSCQGQISPRVTIYSLKPTEVDLPNSFFFNLVHTMLSELHMYIYFYVSYLWDDTRSYPLL